MIKGGDNMTEIKKDSNHLHYNSSFNSVSELVSHLNNILRMFSC